MTSPENENPNKQVPPQNSENANQAKISKFAKNLNEGGQANTGQAGAKSGLNPRSSLNFSLEDSKKDSWYLESGQKPEHKQLASIKESKKESGDISSSNRKRSFQVDSFRDSMSYHDDFDDNMTYT